MNNLAIKLENVKFTYGTKALITIKTLAAYKNERIAIVGKNGSGKTTLLKLIQGIITPHEGTIKTYIKMTYIPQIEYDQLTVDTNTLDFELLSKFHVPDITMTHLSGGEKRKLLLTEGLSYYTEGLLLDEPTTHMDYKGINQLKSILNYHYGLVIFVSHDRDFINEIATQIWEIEDGQINVYLGNYDDYMQQKNEMLEAVKNENDKKQKERKRLQKSLEEKRKQAESIEKISKKQRKRHIKPNRLAASKQKDTVQKSIFKNAKNIEKRIENIGEDLTIGELPQIEFPTVKSLEMHKRFPIMGEDITLTINDKQIFNRLSFQFEKGEKIAIIGDNGTGKTSLLNYIIRNEEGMTISKNAKIKVYEQMGYILDDDQTLIKYLEEKSDYENSLIKSVLLNLGFSQLEINTKKMNELSGGEATKLSIAKLLLEPSNVLILDEPTNFMDVYTIEALENLLMSYKGTVIFTTHDQAFVDKVATQVWEIKNARLQRI
ncbi:hypothetical protein B5C00_01725 [Staphylococcus delphini]|uniref:ribosomal protection-like ABC-F family protein n=1 Tax=Staphylococcus delphini TaxID=53344 RepID=UPI000BBCA622|nr:ABC-F type ribosomal protection protein [Staphylococcus delphini]PCF35729.1 hypothetical protein B5C00_01725 [Staphylococcus delphini]